MFKVVDCNNFWSPSGGGVRRYHLEKMEFYKNQEVVEYRFVMHDDKTFTEQIGPNAFIEHLRVPKVMGNWDYRYLTKSSPLEPVLKQIDPDVIEIGSPYLMPRIVLKIIKRNNLKARTFGFWHADFPVTYVKRFLDSFSSSLSKAGEQLAWKHARKYYNQMDGILSSSELIIKRMQLNGLNNIHFLPLGVNKDLFRPENRDSELIKKYKGDDQNRLILFFPHRFSKEKGLDLLLEAYPLLCEKMDAEPALIIAGMGPYEGMAKKAAEKYEHVHFNGFITDKETMAKYYASSDIGFALSKWETFGLSLLESLSSGLPLIAANDGAAKEHIERSGAGVIMKEHSATGLVNSILDLIDKAKKDDLKSLARNYAEKLTWEACFSKQLKIYQGLTS